VRCRLCYFDPCACGKEDYALTLTHEDTFLLGQAWISFRMGEIDQAINLTLPSTDGSNVQFLDLHKQYAPLIAEMNNPTPENDPNVDESGDVYDWFSQRFANALLEWAIEMGINVRDLLERTKV